jgi:hypothetical protein
MPEMSFVYSSHVVSWGYDADRQEFHVRYGPTLQHPGGRTAVYHGVPPNKAADIMAAPSPGQAIRSHLRDQHQFTYA